MDPFCYFYLVFVCHTVLSVPSSLVYSYLLGKGWPLGSLVCDVCFTFPSGVVLDSPDPDLCFLL